MKTKNGKRNKATGWLRWFKWWNEMLPSFQFRFMHVKKIPLLFITLVEHSRNIIFSCVSICTEILHFWIWSFGKLKNRREFVPVQTVLASSIKSCVPLSKVSKKWKEEERTEEGREELFRYILQQTSRKWNEFVHPSSVCLPWGVPLGISLVSQCKYWTFHPACNLPCPINSTQLHLYFHEKP